MNRLVLTAVSFSALATLAPAQRKLDARSFFPVDYNGEVRADMKAIVGCGMWDGIERSMFRVLIASFHSWIGFDLEDLDAVRFAIREDRDEDGRTTERSVWVFEGDERVGLERMPKECRVRYSTESRGGTSWLRDDAGDEIIAPRPGLLVLGSDEQVGRVVREEVRGGVPHPDLLALTSAPGTLAMIARVMPPPELQRTHDLTPIPDAWFVDDDRPVALRLRLAKQRDVDAVALELLVRFANGTAGPGHFGRELKAWIDGLPGQAESLGPVQKVLGAVATKAEGTDFTATVPLGSAEAAGETLATFGTLLLPAALFAEVAAPAQIPVAVESAPATEPAKPEPGKKR